jgi:radical SAM superfamily enzyme YgiQ (UPF0313 family)
MKVLLSYISGAADRSDLYLNLLPTGLCSLQACLREAGYDAVLANFSGWSDAVITRHLAKLQPDIIGISQWTHNRHAALALARSARNALPASFIVLGGAHATFSYQDNLKEDSPVNCVVLGEGEETVLELLHHLEAASSWHGCNGIAFRNGPEVRVTPPRLPLAELDKLPYAVRYLEHSIGVDLQLQPEFILTSRGCPSVCHFCSSPKFWGRKVRFRSPESVVDEILYIRDRFGLIYFSLRDDTFTVDRTRTIAICRLLIERRVNILWNCQSRVTALDDEVLTWMKRAGCECIQLGVESGSPRILSKLGKTITPQQVITAAGQIRTVGISLSIFLISDIPGETEEDLLQTMELIKNIRPNDGYISPLAYYPGTRLFDDSVQEGRVARSLFEEQLDPALYASVASGRTSRRLLKQCAVKRHQDSAERFRQQKMHLGYCFVTNVLTGEWYRHAGDYGAAEGELREITEQEADNPWGWYLLGELYDELGRHSEAQTCYRAVCTIVPEHKPSRDALRIGAKKSGACRPR